MKSKTILLLLMVVLASLMIGSVSAGFFDEIFEEQPTNVTYDGITFNIPEGFEENSDFNMSEFNVEVGGDDADIQYHFFTDLDNNVYFISIADFNQEFSLDDLNDGKLTEINGHKGYLQKEDGEYTFSYFEDNDTIVVLNTQDKSLFEKIIV